MTHGKRGEQTSSNGGGNVANPAAISLNDFAHTMTKGEIRDPSDPKYGVCTCKEEGVGKNEKCLGCHEKIVMGIDYE